MLGNTAHWQRISDQDGGIWVWQPDWTPVEGDKETLRQLRGMGWLAVDMTLEPTLPFILASHLAPLIYVQIPGRSSLEVWAQKGDIAAARAAPVLLAFQVPPELVEQSESARRGVIHCPQIVPPRWLGNCGLIVGEINEEAGWVTTAYGPTALDADGAKIRTELSEALMRAAGNAGWPLVAPDVIKQLLAPSGYEEATRAMRQHAASEADDQLQASIDYLWIQAQALRDQEERRATDSASWDEQWKTVHDMAARLAGAYWRAHLKTGNAVGATVRTMPQIARVFTDDRLAKIPSAQPVWPILQAITSPARWEEVDGTPTVRHSAQWLDTILQVRHGSTEVAPTPEVTRGLWEQVRAYDDLCGDIFLDMLAQAHATAPDAKGYWWITGERILDDRDMRRKTARDENGHERTAGHRQERLMEISQRVGYFASQWVTLHKWQHDPKPAPEDAAAGGKKKRRKLEYSHESKLMVVAETITQKELVPPEERDGTPAYGVAWRYQPGTWLATFIDGRSPEFAWLCQQALAYDPYREQWEKRLARYFVLFLRIDAARSGGSLTRRVGTLLDELDLPVDERNPERTRKRLEAALDRLVADGVIEGWSYREQSELPARGWFATWREWSVQVVAPPVVMEPYKRIQDRSETLKAIREMRRQAREEASMRPPRRTRKGSK